MEQMGQSGEFVLLFFFLMHFVLLIHVHAHTP